MKIILTSLFIVLVSLVGFGQTKKSDVIVKINGERLTGEIKEIQEDAVKFTYSGETLLYTIKKNEIAKIEFGSGRVEIINGEAKPDASSMTPMPSATTGNHSNKIAILPFSYVADGQTGSIEASQRVQNECYAFLSKHSGPYVVVDNRTVNMLLQRAGITLQTMSNFTMKEICDKLDVSFIVTGMVTVDKTNQTAYGSNNQSSSTKRTDDRNKTSSSTYGSNYSTVTQNYASSVDLEIYNDQGNSVFTENRKAFFHDQDAYKSAMEYLLKRSPIYKK